MNGTVVKLDRGFPLVKCEDGALCRCEHATALVKGKRVRAVIGDNVDLSIPEGHDKGIIRDIFPRSTAFVRKDPAERTASQVLAANFQLVMVAEPLGTLNMKRLERELVLAHETGARVAVILTKADLNTDDEVAVTLQNARNLAGNDVDTLIVSAGDPTSLERVRSLIASNDVAILIGESGVGKSTLVNLLAGRTVQETAEVRSRDGKGRHTTVDRVMVELPGGGWIVDMPGVRGLGLWDADAGLETAFADVEELASSCKFRDCKHVDEPGCAVRAAVSRGALAQARLDSYHSLASEAEAVRRRRDEARQLRGEKASDRKAASKRQAGGQHGDKRNGRSGTGKARTRRHP